MKITAEGFAIIESDTHIGRWVEEEQRLDFDQNAQPLINKYLKLGDVVIDAGANIGCYSYGFLSVIGETGTLHAFEPAKETFECLKHNLNFPNVYLYNNALSNKGGLVKVVYMNKNVGMNFCEEVNHDGVRSISIDSLHLEKCDFIKIDVEGDELNVLIGASTTIDTFRPKMYIEINEHTLKRKGLTKNSIFDWLHIHGYSFKNIYEDQGLDGGQFDIICIFG